MRQRDFDSAYDRLLPHGDPVEFLHRVMSDRSADLSTRTRAAATLVGLRYPKKRSTTVEHVEPVQLVIVDAAAEYGPGQPVAEPPVRVRRH